MALERIPKYMAPLKSSSIYLEMYTQLYADIADECSIPTSERKNDVRTIRRRFRTEGLSFLTKTLPRLGKSLDAALATGNPFVPERFSTFEQVPKLFGSLWRQVISNGRTRSDATPYIIRDLRQLCFYFYKLEVPVESEQVLDAFVQTDEELPSLDRKEVSNHINAVLDRAAIIAARVFGSIDPTDIVPRHGPGAVATRESVVQKSFFKRFYPRLHEVYPYDQYFFGFQQLADDPSCIERMQEVSEPTARVVLVPKDSRGPRIISCEPLEIQYIQQGLKDRIVRRLESHPFTAGFVNFEKQTVNRDLALHASVGNSNLGTFDMKDASDRVSLDLVKRVFEKTPLLPYLEATRSTSTVLPDGRVVKLKKYAPMGSALCFPIEAFIFFALIVSCRAQTRGCSTRSFSAVKSLRPYVYGDDLIFDVKDYDIVEQTFSAVGLAFNKSKCCTAPGFRESCGQDAFAGVSVTPLRCKALWSSNRSSLPSYVAHTNNAEVAGRFRLASFLRKKIEALHGPLPYVAENSAALGWYHASGDLIKLNKGRKVRLNRNLWRLEALTYAQVPLKESAHDGLADMFRNLNISTRDEQGRYTLQRRVKTIRCWRLID